MVDAAAIETAAARRVPPRWDCPWRQCRSEPSVSAAEIAETGVAVAEAVRGNRTLDHIAAISPDLQAAYRIQDLAVGAYGAPVAGWSVDTPDRKHQRLLNAHRLLRPILADHAFDDLQGCGVAVDTGGRSAVVSMRLVVRLGHDLPAHLVRFTPVIARCFIGSVHLGVEVRPKALGSEVRRGVGPGLQAVDVGASLVTGAAIELEAVQRGALPWRMHGVAGTRQGVTDLREGYWLYPFLDALRLAGERGLRFRASQTIALGRIGPSRTLQPGQTIRLDLPTLAASTSVSLTSRSAGREG